MSSQNLQQQAQSQSPLEFLRANLAAYRLDVQRLQHRRTTTVSQALFDRLVPGEGLLPTPSKERRTHVSTQDSHPDTDYVDAASKHKGLVSNDDGDAFVAEEDEELDCANDDVVITIDGVKMSAVQWLNDLRSHTRGLKTAPTPSACPYLRTTIVPEDHQYEALGYVDYNVASEFKGIVLGDPPGLGKTLIAQMAIVRSLAVSKCFSIVVVPSNLVQQWKSEFEKYFEEGSIDVYVLNESTTSCMELFKHDVIITSYPLVMSQYRAYFGYLDAIHTLSEAESYEERQLPKRPEVALFSEILRDYSSKCPYLVLDEAHLLKNSRSLTYAAIMELRERCEACIMLTARPIDDKWEDIYALASLLRAQPLKSLQIAEKMFTAPSTNGQRVLPQGKYLARLHTVLMAWIIRRPEATKSLPPLEVVTVGFDLSEVEATASNIAFKEYRECIRSSLVGHQQSPKLATSGKFSALYKAQQHAHHPKLVEILELVRTPTNTTDLAIDETLDSSDKAAKWENWRAELRHDGEWKSSRVMRIIREFNRQRSLNQYVKVLIFSESVYFLDILDIAFSTMHNPIKSTHFSGRNTREDKENIVEAFNKSHGPAVMMISQAAGGLGLNLATASVVILCAPFWKYSSEELAWKRAHRFGQKRSVTVIRMFAKDCEVEAFRAATRDRKNDHNSTILDRLTGGSIPDTIT